MKRLVKLALTAFIILICSVNVSASDGLAIGEELSKADLSSAHDFLEDNDVDLSQPETIKNVDSFSLLNYFFRLFRETIRSPGKILIITTALALISQLATSVSTKSGLNAEVFIIICFITISPYLLSSLSDMLSAVKSQHSFMVSYMPIFAGITAASGNMSGAVSYNALVLYASEGIAYLASAILKPMLMCMMVMSCAQAINPDLPNLTATIRRFFVAVIGIVMTVFIGVIGLQTVVGRSGNEIALKAGKFLVSSFVPIIGMSISEAYKTVSVSMSAIRTSVGAVGLVVLIVILAVPIISMLSYRIILNISKWTCTLTGAYKLSNLMNGLADVYSLCITVLLIYAMMFIISTGIIIMMGSGVS